MTANPYFVGLMCYCASVFLTGSVAQDTKRTTTLTNRLNGYDKKFRPQHGGPPLAISVHMFVSSFGPVSELDMEFRLEIYLQQQWFDERLAFEDNDHTLTVNHETMAQIWTPDTFFLNEKYGYTHTVTQPNVLLRISGRGQVTFDTRLTIQAACNMDFRMYPFDKQTCFLKLESYSYSTQDVVYNWHEETPIGFTESISLSKYTLLGYETSHNTSNFIMSNYSDLQVDFFLGRDISHQLIKTYVPCTLIVVLSWLSLWIPRDATPARVTLGITTVLTLTTTMGNSDRHLPVLTYLTALDIFTTVCNFFVFAVLIEFAFVSFYDKPVYRERRKAFMAPKTNQMGQQKPVSSWEQMKNEDATGVKPQDIVFTVSNQKSHIHPNKREGECEVRQQSWPIGKADIASKFEKVNNHVRRGLQPAKVELYARIAMPLFFLAFTVVYYLIYVVANCDFDTGHSL